MKYKYYSELYRVPRNAFGRNLSCILGLNGSIYVTFKEEICLFFMWLFIRKEIVQRRYNVPYISYNTTVGDESITYFINLYNIEGHTISKY